MLSNCSSIHFAPIQGYTDAIYRNVHARIFGGIDTYYTPFVRLEKDTFRNKDLHDINPSVNEAPIIPQLLGSTPEELKRIASLFISQGYTHADINLGCPFIPIVRKYKGAGLLPYPEKVAALFAVLEEIPELTFSIKMRLGWENSNECLTLLPLINDFAFSHITVHARIGVQQYKGETDLEGFGKFYEQCAHPVYFNGDIQTKEDMENLKNRFPHIQGFVIGRGLLANPALASEYKEGKKMPLEEKRQKLQLFHKELFTLYEARLQGETQLLTKLKTIWDYLLPDAERKLRKKISKSSRLEQYTEAVQTLLTQYTYVQ
ncbi:tRNA dihydrouridine synthase [Parabacteroides pacaensis]|uniref:tRNA dihydrouridine synthase n=1 Tax=Parabacteroides pacaensis TaxID=2086575 RepID=UPI000D0FBBB8|nr:tRNA-dihydrouridine synthase family protein [Parabacteroides pacaensis]